MGGLGFWNPVGGGGGSSDITIEEVTTTTYTVVSGDNGKVKRFTNAAEVTVTLPDALAVGTLVHLLFDGAGGGVVEDNGVSTVIGGGSVSDSGEASCIVSTTDTWEVVRTGAGAGSSTVMTVETETGTSYTVDASDDGKLKRFTAATAVTVTLPHGLAVGTIVELLSWGSAGLTVQGNGTSTVQQAGSINQYEAVSCVVVTTDTWSVVGPLA